MISTRNIKPTTRTPWPLIQRLTLFPFSALLLPIPRAQCLFLEDTAEILLSQQMADPFPMSCPGGLDAEGTSQLLPRPFRSQPASLKPPAQYKCQLLIKLQPQVYRWVQQVIPLRSNEGTLCSATKETVSKKGRKHVTNP